MVSTAVAYDIVARDRASKAFRNVANSAAASQKRIDSVGRSLTNAGSRLTRSVTVPAVAAAGAAIKMASDFDTSMQKINGLAGVSQKQVDAWKNDVLQLSGKVARSPQELADALQFIASSGIKGQRALDALRASARAAAAGLGDTQTVADAVTSAMNAYGPKAMSAGRATDILTQAVKDGKAEASTLAPVMGRVIPIASQMGVSFDQVAASIASMSLSGMDAAEAATSTQAFLSGLLKPSVAGAKALKSVGLSFEGLRNELKQKGLLATMQTLKGAFKGNDDQLAKVVPNVRALRGMLALVGVNGKTVDKIFRDLKHSTGATDKAFGSASKTAEFKFKSSLSKLQAAAIQLGNKAMPVVVSIMNKAMAAFGKFNSMPKPFKVITLGAIGFVAALGPVLSVAGNLVTAYGGVRRAFTAVREACVLTRIQLIALKVAEVATAVASRVMAVATRLVNAAMKANPIGLVVTALIALAAGLIYAYKHSETFRKIVNGAFHAIAAAGKWMWNSVLKPTFKFLIDTFLNVASGIVNGAAHAFGWVPGLGSKLKAAAKWFNDFKDHINNQLNGIHNKTVTVTARTLGMGAVTGLIDKIAQIKDKTVHIGASVAAGALKPPHRAMGGPVTPRRMYLVGERGPELFTPGSAGRITSNRDLRRAASDDGRREQHNHIHINMPATATPEAAAAAAGQRIVAALSAVGI